MTMADGGVLRPWWERGSWVGASAPVGGKASVGSDLVLLVAATTILVVALAIGAAVLSTVALVHGRSDLGRSITSFAAPEPAWRTLLMAATRDVSAFDGALLVGSALLLVGVRPDALAKHKRKMWEATRALTSIFAVTGILLAITAVADLPSPTPGPQRPDKLFYGGAWPLVLDRVSVVVTALAALWLVNGEPLARHLTARRIRRQEG